MKIISFLIVIAVAVFNSQTVVSSKVAGPICATAEIENCLTYASSTTCALCDGDLFPNDDRTECKDCKDIISDCTACDIDGDATVCTACGTGYLPKTDGSACTTCSVADCSNCDTDNTCAKCTGDKVPNGAGSECKSCAEHMPHCATCTTFDACTSCTSPKALKTSKDGCDDCATVTSDADCIECELDDMGSTQCKSCTAPKIVSSTGTCVECDATGCLTCLKGVLNARTSSTDTCDTCPENKWKTDDGNCDDCSNAVFDCEECTENSGETKCTKCKTGKMLTENDKCIDCGGTDCLTCKSDTETTKCGSCADGKTVSVDELSCIDCTAESNCKTCTSATPAVCITCGDDMYLKDNVCKECGDAIADCTDCEKNGEAAKCKACSGGKVPNNAGDTCIECSTLESGCETCSVDAETGNSQCDSCTSPKSLTNSKTCVDCSSVTNCQVCQDASNCFTCNSEFINDAGTCKECSTGVSGCSTCKDNKCVACDNDKYPSSDGRACEDCDAVIDGCKTCDVDSAGETICTACTAEKNFPSYDGKCCAVCASALGECTTCVLADGKTTCSGCGASKELSHDSRKCVTCEFENCEKCEDNEVCNACESDYQFNDDNSKCEAIPDDNGGSDGDNSGVGTIHAGILTIVLALAVVQGSFLID